MFIHHLKFFSHKRPILVLCQLCFAIGLLVFLLLIFKRYFYIRKISSCFVIYVVNSLPDLQFVF